MALSRFNERLTGRTSFVCEKVADEASGCVSAPRLGELGRLSWPSIPYLKRRTVLGARLPSVVEPSGGDVGVPEPLLHARGLDNPQVHLVLFLSPKQGL
jgi:hypothetical protein